MYSYIALDPEYFTLKSSDVFTIHLNKRNEDTLNIEVGIIPISIINEVGIIGCFEFEKKTLIIYGKDFERFFSLSSKNGYLVI